MTLFFKNRDKINKKIAYWGNGKVCKKLLELYPAPDLIIDSRECKDKNIPIEQVSISEFKDFKDYIIVITVADSIDIEEILLQRKLEKGKDFCNYLDYFGLEKYSMRESLIEIKRQVEKKPSLIGRVLISAPFFFERRSKEISTYFKKYIACRNKNDFLILNLDYNVANDLLEKKIGCAVINRACGTSYYLQSNQGENYRNIEPDISGDEYEFIRWLERTKNNDSFDNAVVASSKIYSYFKMIIGILKPRAIIWWGGWDRTSFIIRDIAKRNNITVRIAEYGWIPGTYQFDAEGIAGASIFCNKKYIEHCNRDNKNIQYIFDSVTKNEMDSYQYVAEDKQEVETICMKAPRPCILLVGMGEAGMNVNPYSEYWREKISCVVSSSDEAYCILKEICEKKRWGLLYKPHPKEREGESGIGLPESSTCRIINNISIDRLINISTVVVSITSAVDFKVLMYRKPLIQIGINSLNISNSTYLVESIDTMEAVIKEAIENGMTERQMINFEDHMAKLLSNLLWDDLEDRELRFGKSVYENIVN